MFSTFWFVSDDCLIFGKVLTLNQNDFSKTSNDILIHTPNIDTCTQNALIKSIIPSLPQKDKSTKKNLKKTSMLFCMFLPRLSHRSSWDQSSPTTGKRHVFVKHSPAKNETKYNKQGGKVHAVKKKKEGWSGSFTSASQRNTIAPHQKMRNLSSPPVKHTCMHASTKHIKKDINPPIHQRTDQLMIPLRGVQCPKKTLQ